MTDRVSHERPPSGGEGRYPGGLPGVVVSSDYPPSVEEEFGDDSVSMWQVDEAR